MNKKNILIIIITFIIIISAFFRYTHINAKVAKEYKVDEYEIGQEIPIDNLKLTVISKEIVDNIDENSDFYSKSSTEFNSNDFIHILINVNIENSTKNDIPIMNLVSSSLSDGYLKFDSLPGLKGNESLSRNVGPNGFIIYKLRYDIPKEKYNLVENKLKLYLDSKLYEKELKEKYKQLIRYRKCINL